MENNRLQNEVKAVNLNALAAPLSQERPEPSTSQAAATPIPVTFSNVKTSAEDFYVFELDGYVSPGQIRENWEEIELQPNVGQMLKLIRTRFFAGIKSIKRYTGMFVNMDGQHNFRIDTQQRIVEFNRNTLMKSSRGRLVGAVMHALIHCCVSESICSLKHFH